MNIVPFPGGPRDPQPTPPSPAKRAARAVRGVALETAREAAGLTHDALARRMVMLLRLRQGQGHDLSAFDESDFVPRLTRALEFMERVSQATYDRTAVWFATPPSERPEQGRPRIYLPKYGEAFDAIAVGDAGTTTDDLRKAAAAQVRAEQSAHTRRMQDELNHRGASIARLVWNHADDPTFLDRVLVDELAGDVSASDSSVTGWAGYLVRVALGDLARELRLTFPSRPLLAVEDQAAA